MGKGWDRDVDINQCVFIFLFIQQLFLTFQHEIKNSINQSIILSRTETQHLGFPRLVFTETL